MIEAVKKISLLYLCDLTWWGIDMVWVKKEKKTQSQHIYLSCNDKGRSGIKSAERARSIYSEGQEKNRVSGTKPSYSTVGLNTSSETRKNSVSGK